MRQSKLFTKAERTSPKDEVAKNAKLLARAGFVRKLSAGIYAYLPLGWRVMNKIMGIIREEMNAIGGQEMFMPAMVEKKYMEATGRWGLDVGFEVGAKGEKNAAYTLGWTHEEVLTVIASKFVGSYKDLPFYAYQIQTKFRNEARPQGGLIRTKEFLMKDLYSFHASEKDLLRYYEEVKQAYFRIFERCGLKTLYTIAAGGDFTISNTHEFQVLSEVGEDMIFYCEKCEYSENSEISKLNDGSKCPKCGGNIQKGRAIEAGNIFPLGTKYAEAFGLSFLDKEGKKQPVVMGSYGIGVGRLMGTIAEVLSDEEGLVWPVSVAPFAVHLLDLGGSRAETVYGDLQKAGISVLFDDRAISPGEKLVESALIGIPFRAVTSERTGEKIELKLRNEKETKLVTLSELTKILKP
ncbi:MAG: Prolyl-tRNA synthetase [Parcubacteria group bacterium GW2011_GWA1_50_14]|nr:MAG: Prolyl-tRNA synthetase [Parcubacteria group bacterium GW2011_GWA1_50_14]